MFSGVKFIPRDQLRSGGDSASLEELSSKKKESRRRKEKHKRKTRKYKHHTSSSDDDDGLERVGRSNKKWYNSDEDSLASSSSRSASESLSDGERDTSRENGKSQELARKEMGLDWMLKSGNASDRKAVASSDALEESQPEKEVEKFNPKEINPYLKDNGGGYPEGASIGKNKLLPTSVIGDGGASWRLKALKRAREQAAREGRKLDEVVEERWGSLGQLTSSFASRRAAPARAHLHAIKDRKKGITDTSETVIPAQTGGGAGESQHVRKPYLEDVSARHPDMRKPKREPFPRRKGKDNNSTEDKSLISSAVSSLNKYSNDGSSMNEIQKIKDASVSHVSATNMDAREHSKVEHSSSRISASAGELSVNKQGLSSNQLAAKALQLRLKGKHEEAEKLMKEVETMNVSKEMRIKTVIPETRGNTTRRIEERISGHSKQEEDADLYLAQKIMQNKQYSMSKQADDEYDFDDDAPKRKRNRRPEGLSEEKSQLSNRLLTQEQRCQFCFENPKRPKHLVVSIAQFTYMALPQWQPVVEGHCCILPMQHESATRTVDDNVWDEIRNFKKCLIMMFAKLDKGVLFLETVMGLAKQRRHCVVECIPVPHDIAKEAPLYFKKAIDEAEDEWSQHNSKKLIRTTREKGLRRSVPKDFPYFHVEFGLDEGFVHVIDDEGDFNSSLGLNVIRGMLQLPEEDMHRRRRHEPLEKQRLAVAAFAREWEPFDWTKQLS